jgi:hypothetical protein
MDPIPTKNPLSRFRSYSYYHVLVAGNSSETLTELIKSTDKNAWSFAKNTNDPLGGMAVQTIGDNGKYCVLINGSESATFVIMKATITAAVIANAVANDNGQSATYEGTLVVNEPRGIIFLHRLVKCAQELGADLSYIPMVLKTFFVGHADSGEIEVISDVYPYLFVTDSVTGSFSEGGGTYEMITSGLVGGVARRATYSSAGTAIHFTTGETLKSAVDNWVAGINAEYDRNYRCALLTTQKISADNATKLRKVTYKAILDPIYQSPEYTMADQQEVLKPFGGCDGQSQVTIAPGYSFESALRDMMKSCRKVKDEIAANQFMFKIVPVFEDVKPSGDLGDAVITYRIYRVPMPGINTAAVEENIAKTEQAAGDTTSDPHTDLSGTLVYDYIYTGKNVEVLEFDISMKMTAYILNGNINNTYPSSKNLPQSNTIISNTDAKVYANRHGNNPTTIYHGFGTKVKNNGHSSNFPAISGQAAMNMRKYATTNIANATMKVMGNPILLAKLSEHFSPGKHTTENNPSADSSKLENTFTTVPKYVRVNIKMPRNADDYSLFNGIQTPNDNTESNDYAVDFWFDGEYMLGTVVHEFSEGNFTQELHLYNIPKTAEVISNPTPEDKDTIVLPPECGGTDIIPCSAKARLLPPTSEGPNIPAAQQLAGGLPASSGLLASGNIPAADQKNNTNLLPDAAGGLLAPPIKNPLVKDTKNPVIDKLGDFTPPTTYILDPLHADEINNKIISSGALRKIDGWDASSASVKQAIMDMAIKHQVNVLSVAKFASVESARIKGTGGFNPNSKVPPGKTKYPSSATGLFQILKGTWSDINKTGGGPGYPPTDANMMNPVLNAEYAILYSKYNYNHFLKHRPDGNDEVHIYGTHNLGGAGYTDVLNDISSPRALKAIANNNLNGARTVQQYKAAVRPWVSHNYHGGKQVSGSNDLALLGAPRTVRGIMGDMIDCNELEEVKNDPTQAGCEQINSVGAPASNPAPAPGAPASNTEAPATNPSPTTPTAPAPTNTAPVNNPAPPVIINHRVQPTSTSTRDPRFHDGYYHPKKK